MFDRDPNRMLAFRDFNDADLHAIAAPVLILDGDADVVRPEHAPAYIWRRMVNSPSCPAATENTSERFAPEIKTALIEQFLAADTSVSQTP
jgi:pimeloyl-ACP methyl ester carboxylesterase